MRVVIAATILGLAGCQIKVDQHAHSGKDKRMKGAKQIKLEGGKGRAKGTVTYPGGDRIDWKFFELPQGEHSVKIKLLQRPARPELDIAFDVYDEYGHRIGRVKSRKKPRRSKTVKLRGASGKIYLQIYAPDRSDAADYLVSVRYKPGSGGVDPKEVLAKIPDPPTLPTVPGGAGSTNPNGQNCPQGQTPGPTGGCLCPNGQPPGPQGCGGTAVECPPNATADATGKCVCKNGQPAPESGCIDAVNARVLRYRNVSGGVTITISAGTKAGVREGWKGHLVDSRGSRVNGSDFTVRRATSGRCVGRVKLSLDQAKRGKKAVLSP